jgi:hypothetical protein
MKNLSYHIAEGIALALLNCNLHHVSESQIKSMAERCAIEIKEKQNELFSNDEGRKRQEGQEAIGNKV